MRRVFLFAVLLAFRGVVRAQDAPGALEFTARVTPTAARAEPVREFTFYLLTKSYREIVREVGERYAAPSRDQFIDRLEVSAEFRDWLHKHEILDVTRPGFDK